jgi:hypothetical protein
MGFFLAEKGAWCSPRSREMSQEGEKASVGSAGETYRASRGGRATGLEGKGKRGFVVCFGSPGV